MRFTITITFRIGPTILEEDTPEITIRRAAATQEQVAKIHKAALELDAVRVSVEDSHGEIKDSDTHSRKV
jgi:hypothetical protein